MDTTLRFRPDGDFTLMQLTDMHCVDDAETNRRTRALAERLIEWEKPDFIMNTGDAVYGPDSASQLDDILAPIAASGIPWSFTLGNHDGEYLNNKPELFDRLIRMPNCRLWHDPDSGARTGNHWLALRNDEGVPEWVFFGLDSGMNHPDARVGGYDVITREQIDWYRRAIAAFEREAPDFSTMLFQHMALPEFETVWRYEVTRGMRREGIGAPRINTGFFSALLESGHAKGVFVGHDHVNDFYGTLYGVTLGYGRQSGYGSYSAPDFQKGCRMFRFTRGSTGTFETWLRLERGDRIDDPWTRRPQEARDDG